MTRDEFKKLTGNACISNARNSHSVSLLNRNSAADDQIKRDINGSLEKSKDLNCHRLLIPFLSVTRHYNQFFTMENVAIDYAPASSGTILLPWNDTVYERKWRTLRERPSKFVVINFRCADTDRKTLRQRGFEPLQDQSAAIAIYYRDLGFRKVDSIIFAERRFEEIFGVEISGNIISLALLFGELLSHHDNSKKSTSQRSPSAECTHPSDKAIFLRFTEYVSRYRHTDYNGKSDYDHDGRSEPTEYSVWDKESHCKTCLFAERLSTADLETQQKRTLGLSPIRSTASLETSVTSRKVTNRSRTANEAR